MPTRFLLATLLLGVAHAQFPPAPPPPPIELQEGVEASTPSVEPEVAPQAFSADEPGIPTVEPGVDPAAPPTDEVGAPTMEPGMAPIQAPPETYDIRPALPATQPMVPPPGDSDVRPAQPLPAQPLPAQPLPAQPLPAQPAPPAQPVPTPPPVATGPIRQKPTIDDIARFIAGATFTPQSAYRVFDGSSLLQVHRLACKEMAEQWEGLRLQKMRAWSAAEIAPFTRRANCLLYMFGGPDLIYANTLFPTTPEYVLAGLEPVGRVPEFFSYQEKDLEAYLVQLRFTLRSNMTRSFFQTAEMQKDFGQQGVDGVFPVLLYFAILGGNEVLEASHISLGQDGSVLKAGPDGMGIRMVMRSLSRASARPQTVYYFKTDLSNDGLSSRLLKFLSNRGAGGSYLKAASYLMHQNGFSKIRDYLLNRSSFILEDESGIPFRHFAKGWDVRLYGRYAGPVDIFQQYYQPDLSAAFRSPHVKPLPFGVGYRRDDSESLQIFSIRR